MSGMIYALGCNEGVAGQGRAGQGIGGWMNLDVWTRVSWG